MSKIGQFSIISPRAKLADDVLIGSFCIIEDGVTIEAGTVIKNYVEIRKGTKIGRECYVDSGVKCSGRAKIEDRVVVRYDAIIARGCKLGSDSYIAPQVMFQNLDHERREIGGASVGKSCFIGTNATINAGIVIADKTVIGAKSLVTKTIDESGWIYMGIPVKRYQRLSRAFEQDCQPTFPQQAHHK